MTIRTDVVHVLCDHSGMHLHQQRVYDLLKQHYRRRRVPWKADSLQPQTVFRTLRKLAEDGKQEPPKSIVQSDGEGSFWVPSDDVPEQPVGLVHFLGEHGP